MSYPNTAKFLKRHLQIDDCLSPSCRQMILDELTAYVVSCVAKDSDLYDVQCRLTYGGFLIYPAMYDLGDSNFSNGIEDDEDVYDNVLEALAKDQVDLSNLWTEDDSSLTWTFRGETYVYTKATKKLTYEYDKVGTCSSKALREAFCPKSKLLE